jgi:hypothetical protein
MAPQLLTAQDEEDFGPEILDMSRRAALDALSPALAQLQIENQQLRQAAQRQQRAEIERALDRQVPDWRNIYSDPAFAQWLSQSDEYSGQIRSQLMRNAVANGDSARVVQFYRGFQQEASQPQYRSRGSGARTPAIAGRIYSREDIRRLYEQRARGGIPDASWGPIEADIVAAAREGRVRGVFDLDGNQITR